MLWPGDWAAQKPVSVFTREGSDVTLCLCPVFLTGTKKSAFALVPSSLGVSQAGVGRHEGRAGLGSPSWGRTCRSGAQPPLWDHVLLLPAWRKLTVAQGLG